MDDVLRLYGLGAVVEVRCIGSAAPGFAAAMREAWSRCLHPGSTSCAEIPEAKEVVGGWSLLEYASVEEAVADQKKFAELHAEHWPEVTVVSTLRQISEGPEAPDA